MISYEDALKIIQGQAQKITPRKETVDLEQAVGFICAEDIKAAIDVQPFDNSAMDGFAVRTQDLEGASETSPVTLKKMAIVAAGNQTSIADIEAGTCVEIMTGAPVPANAGAVVPVELTSTNNDGDVVFTADIKKASNIRYAGEDFKEGAVVLSKSTQIQAQHVMGLATLGIDKVEVFSPLKGVFLSTGDELVDDLSQELKPGQIYNSNRPYGLAILKQMGISSQEVPKMPDDLESFTQFLKNSIDQGIEIIISSGAVSAGKFDFVREGLEQLGAEILFHKVKMKPGKPNLFARLPNGTIYFGLPGNPVATAVGLRFFVQNYINAVMGKEIEKPIKVCVENNFRKRAGMRIFLKAQLKVNLQGGLEVEILDGQESFKVSPLMNMNAWAVCPEDIEELQSGDLIDVYPINAQGNFF